MANAMKQKTLRRLIRARRVRARLHGTSDIPRLSVHRSLKHISAQLIDDVARKTLVAASDRDLADTKGKKPVEVAREVGSLVAQRAVQKGMTKAIFDRGSFLYHGRVAALAEGAREAGLTM